MKSRLTVFALILLVLMSQNVFASDASSIVSEFKNKPVSALYHVEASGLTSEAALSQKLGIPEQENFADIQQLISKTESYLQLITNTRLFKNIQVDYLKASDSSCDVFISMTSVLTFVAAPYPKYDSNYGLQMKIKVFDSNFLGSLGGLNMTIDLNQQTEGNDSNIFDFASTSFGVKLELEDVYLGEAVVSSTVEGVIDLSSDNWQEASFLDAELGIRNIPLGKARMAAVLEAGGNLAGFNGFETGFRFDFSGMNVGSEILLDFSPYVGLKAVGSLPADVKLDFAGAVAQASYRKFAFEVSFNDYFLKSRVEPYRMYDFTASYHLLDWFIPSLCLEINRFKDEDFFKDISLAAGLELSYKAFEFEFGEKTRVDFETELTDFTVFGSAKTQGGGIDYFRDDFRHGAVYSFETDGIYTLLSDFSDKTHSDNYVRAHAELVWFPLQIKYFNPSIRLIASVSDRHLGLFRPEELDTEDSDKAFGFIYNDKEQVLYLGEYLRGVRNTDSKSLAVYNSCLAAVANFDFTLSSAITGRFLKLYFTPFIDAAILYDFEEEKPFYFASAGIDFSGVLRAYSAYPVRISIGADLAKAKEMIDTRNVVDGFFEVFIGLYHFY